MRKEKETREIQKNIELQEEKQRQRDEAFAERGRRIQEKMDRMADKVDNKDKELMMQQDREYIRLCNEQAAQQKQNEINRKMKARKECMSLKAVYDEQVNAKRLEHERDDKANKSYMKKWMNLNEAEEKRLKEKEQEIKAKNKQLEQFLLDQMTANPNSVKLTNEVAIKRKFELGG